MDVDSYLHRINLPARRSTDLGYLTSLQHAHLLSVPFENLSVRHGEEIRLTLPWLYDKIVVRRRGGFCYELNGLFHWLLQEEG